MQKRDQICFVRTISLWIRFDADISRTLACIGALVWVMQNWSSVSTDIWAKLKLLSQNLIEPALDQRSTGFIQMSSCKQVGLKVIELPKKSQQAQYYLFQCDVICHSGRQQIQEPQRLRMQKTEPKPDDQKSRNPDRQTPFIQRSIGRNSEGHETSDSQVQWQCTAIEPIKVQWEACKELMKCFPDKNVFFLQIKQVSIWKK